MESLENVLRNSLCDNIISDKIILSSAKVFFEIYESILAGLLSFVAYTWAQYHSFEKIASLTFRRYF
jgi:hypothetical protein